jgi:hypothetical protein
MKQTIAQQIKWDFKTNGDLQIQDKNGKLIYMETSRGFWEKREWDSQGNRIYFENSDGDWSKYEMDSQGKLIYWENSRGYWEKCEYDSQGNRIYYENSHGEIIDNRPKSCEGKMVEFDGVKYKLVKV